MDNNTIKIPIDDSETFTSVIIGLVSKGACFESVVVDDNHVISITGT